MVRDLLEEYRDGYEMWRCVELHHIQGKNQEQVARALRFSPAKVSRLLKKAQTYKGADGKPMIEPKLNPPPFYRIAAGIQEAYPHLGEVIVVPHDGTKASLAIAAARYFENAHLKPGQTVGISGGDTLFRTVLEIQDNIFQGLEFFALSSVFSEEALKQPAPNTLARSLAAKQGSVSFALYPIVGWKDLIDPRLEPIRQSVQYAYEAAHEVDLAIFGVGSYDSNSPGIIQLAKRHGGIAQLEQVRAVGEVNCQLIDEDGNIIPLPEELRLRSVAVSLERLRELALREGKRVVIVGGEKKEAVLAAALRGKLCNVLITDHLTGKYLVENNN